jgi:hypothetical protein
MASSPSRAAIDGYPRLILFSKEALRKHSLV